jgi:tetratricopeptide (TPR) repeat protein
MLTARDAACLPKTVAVDPITLAVPGRARVEAMLREDLALGPEVARDILDAVGEPSSLRDGLHLVFRVVADCASRLVWRPDGFGWAPGFGGKESVPVPSSLADSVDAVLQRQPETRDLLACAACFGNPFDGEVVAEALGQSTLEALQRLDRLGAETGLVGADDDGRYSFRPPILIDVLRQRMKISGVGPLGRGVPPVVRELHAQLARVIEARRALLPDALSDLARHTYAAGPRHAAEGLERCLAAARAASRRFDHPGALRFLEMARECAEASGRVVDFEEEDVVLRCHEAFVMGAGSLAAAEAGLRALASRPAPPGRLVAAVARACFEGLREAGAGRREQLLADTRRLGEMLTLPGRAPLEQAEGHHFVALAAAYADRPAWEPRLRRALVLLPEESSEGTDLPALRAQVLNSLAERLVYSGEADNLEARRLFAESLAIKERLGDLPGRARSHGGLGRSYLESPRDLAQARQHLEEDLKIAGQIEDRGGQSMMHSQLGRCDVLEQQWESAATRYSSAFELAPTPKDRFFAAAGRLRALAAFDSATMDSFGAQVLVEARSAGVPPGPRGDLQDAVKACLPHSRGDWAPALLELCGGPSESAAR